MVIALSLIMIVAPIVGFPSSIWWLCQKKQFKFRYLIPLIIFFGIIGFNYIPIGTNDLTRYFIILNNYRDISYSSFLNVTGKDSPLFFVQNYLFFISSRFETNQILPAITVVVVFISGLYIAIDYSKREKLNKFATLGMVLLFLVGMRLDIAAGNVRNISAAALVSVGLYRELFLNKSSIGSGIFYLLGISMHIGVLPVVILRYMIMVVINIWEKHALTWKDLIIIICSLIGGYLLFKYGILDELASKHSAYTNGGFEQKTDWFQALDRSVRFKFTKYSEGIILLIASFLICKLFYKREMSAITMKILFPVIGILGVTLFLITQTGSTYMRYYYFFYFFAPIIFSLSKYDVKKNSKWIWIILCVFYIVISLFDQWFNGPSNIDVVKFVSNVWIIPFR
ncbi:hypothetical protein [Dellaglioa algida]|uniref:EpsG family protein n=1 Tax=Dellaglioa algida TaxID=105612 RepID=A0A5C6MDY4_9LACO|nr:hypothetical protein [Dellaglioa algida]MDK1717138.1 hypothetical protein [Dellaglioa algida]MDK1719792.1 hypothetical protein [Dellaglioa algida]MDK1722080.1 hypothetical protein [Dellaglioa algida]MDK1723135.1 hypothetical protein [Dellaglioa algida]MDK1739913.1 hypothetical protein [Dellaglioa algida]